MALFTVFFSCKNAQNTIQIKIERSFVFDSLPSGSGIVAVKNHFLILGDDAPFIYRYFLKNDSLARIPVQNFQNSGNRIDKKIKPDFEAMAKGIFNREETVFSFGSGSRSPERESLLYFPSSRPENHQIVSLSDFYKALRTSCKTSLNEWNIEGAAIVEDSLILLNRANNQIMVLARKTMESFLKNKKISPAPRCYFLKIPKYGHFQPRISGAAAWDGNGNILFSASMEDTPQWDKDGPVIGSGIGVFNFHNGQVLWFDFLRDDSGMILKKKIESVEVLEKSESLAAVLALSDNDDGKTGLYLLKIGNFSFREKRSIPKK